MKAAVRRAYGPPSTLTVEELPRPRPRSGELLVRVRSVSLNASDLEAMTGRPVYARVFGLFSPREPVLGSDVTGVVEEVGADVRNWSPGDEVMGDVLGEAGVLSEWSALPAERVMKKPAHVSFDEASTFPQAAAIAFQGLEGLRSGERVLLNGGGGGSGAWAIQLAKARGAHVIAVDRGSKLDFMRSQGADEVLDYSERDFVDACDPVDRILDAVATRPLRRLRRVLAPQGTYWAVGGDTRRLLEAAALGWTAGGGRKMGVLALRPNGGVAEMLELHARGVVRAPIRSVVTLDGCAQALGALAAGEVAGKIVVRVSS